MMFPKPLVAYCREKSIMSSKNKSHLLVLSEEKIEEKGANGVFQIELQQVFLKNVHFLYLLELYNLFCFL